jgi:dUTP pyrophosphatase
MSLKAQVIKLSPEAQLPEYATDGSACFDIRAYLPLNKEHPVYIVDNSIINTGLAFEVPEGHVMQVFSRSGHGFKHDVRLANCVAIIDSDYRGELMIKLTNDGLFPFEVKHGDRIAQGMIVPIPKVEFLEVNELTDTVRGEGGLGSTGQGTIGLHWGLTPEQLGNNWFNPNNINDWEATEFKHVWYSPSINKYCYSDEASQYDTTPYDTLGAAKVAFDKYVEQLTAPKEDLSNEHLGYGS